MKRMVDSHIFESESVADLPIPGRYLLIGLISIMADSQGRFRLVPALIRSKIFWPDDIGLDQIEIWLKLMAENGTLLIYKDPDGREIGQFVKWWHYQRPQFVSPSKLPPPDGWKDRIRYTVTTGKIVTYNWTLNNGTRVEDTCDANGLPYDPDLLALVKQTGPLTDDEGGSGDDDEHVDVQVNQQVATQDKDKDEDKDGEEGKDVYWSHPWPEDRPVTPVFDRRTSTRKLRASDYRKPLKTFRIDTKKFGSDGRIPRGQGTTPLEVWYEFYSASDKSEALTTLQCEELERRIKDDQLEQMREAIVAWISNGNKPRNLNGICDWTEKGYRSNLDAFGASRGTKGKSKGWRPPRQQPAYDPSLEQAFN